MYEESKKFSWVNFFIKGIIVIIFVLFTVWLLSLSNKGINNSLNVLTDNIFAENIDKMKEVGQSYFTTERLPKKVGDVETLSLSKMYDKKLILELKDKNGNTCSATDSYVSIEKLDNEYQMKVYLECGEEKDHIIVIMGCYDYCDSDICERKDIPESKQIEYEYKKTTGGKWTDYGNWSEWSKVSVTKTDYRQVETKTIKEEYTYDKTVYENEYTSLLATCPSGYTMSSDKTTCYKVESKVEYANTTCPKTYNGYTFVSKNGDVCNYKKTVQVTANPVCPTKEGWIVTRNGFTCNYSKTVPYTYTYTGTCYRLVPQRSCAINSSTGKYECSTRDVEEAYSCSQTGTSTKEETDTATATCPSGYKNVSNKCTKDSQATTTTAATCPAGYNKTTDNKCSKTVSKTVYGDLLLSCPAGYNKTTDESECYKTVPHVIKVTGTRDVTLYRYRVREYIGGSVDYKWSKSKDDKELLNAGYKLTGKTR